MSVMVSHLMARVAGAMKTVLQLEIAVKTTTKPVVVRMCVAFVSLDMDD